MNLIDLLDQCQLKPKPVQIPTFYKGNIKPLVLKQVMEYHLSVLKPQKFQKLQS